MAEYDSFYRCTIGTTGLSVMACHYHEEKVVREGSLLTGAAIGKKIVVKVDAFVVGTTPADLVNNLLAAKAALNNSGQDFNLYENSLSTPSISIIAARLIDGGPHYEFDVEDVDALRKDISFTLTALTARVGSGGGSDTVTTDDQTQFDLKLESRADGLRTWTRTGELRGPNLVDMFLSILAGFESQYRFDVWTHTHEYELGTFTDRSNGVIVDQGDVLKYTMTAVENADRLPGLGENFAVEGTASARSDRDEQHRMVESFEWDLLLSGDDGSRVLEAIRDTLPKDRVAQRETIEFTSIKERRLRASFVFLRSADGENKDGVALMNWTQSFRTVRAADVYEEKQYPGLDPILIKKPKALERIVQSGTAIGAGDFPDPAPALFADSLLEQPEITFSHLNDVEKQTEWTYTMAKDDDVDVDLNKSLGRPSDAK